MGVPSRSGDPREHNWDRTPTHSHLNLDPRSPGLPRPGCAPGAFPAAVATTESTTGKPTPNPTRSRLLPHAARVRPAPARSRYLPASSVHARVGAGCRSMGDVSGA